MKNDVILAYDSLKKNLKRFKYTPVERAVEMWQPKMKRTKFYVSVDDFGVKHYTKQDAEHLLNALESNHKYAID